jgi:hypothetical protein
MNDQECESDKSKNDTNTLTTRAKYSESYKNYRFYKKRNISKIKFRRQFFRDFQTWYKNNESRFPLPLYIFNHSRNNLSLTIGVISGFRMKFNVNYDSSSYQHGGLNFYWGDDLIDQVCWIESYPRKINEGYICSECHREGVDLRTFPNRLALWEDHIFEVVLDMVIKVANSQQIEMIRWSTGGSFVRFVDHNETLTKLDNNLEILDVIDIKRLTLHS